MRVAGDRKHVEVLKGGGEMERDFNAQFESMGVHRLLMAQVSTPHAARQCWLWPCWLWPCLE